MDLTPDSGDIVEESVGSERYSLLEQLSDQSVDH